MARNMTTLFASGDAVRAKSGTADPDFPDIPIGGWAGRITEVRTDDPPLYLVRWSRETLDQMHPVYRKRCEREGLEFEEMWLPEADLEPDTGQSVRIEQPTKIEPKPLDMQDEEDRTRAVFGLTRDDPLPTLEVVTLRTYRDYLAAHLSFPFEAKWEPESGPYSAKSTNVTVIGLGAPDEEFRFDETYGLICEIRIGGERTDALLAELQATKRDRNRQLLADYCGWFSNAM